MDADIATLRAFFATAPFMADLGIEPVDSGAGRVATQLALQARHFQHSGVVHAGVMAAMADHTMGAAAQTMTERRGGARPLEQQALAGRVFLLDAPAHDLVADDQRPLG